MGISAAAGVGNLAEICMFAENTVKMGMSSRSGIFISAVTNGILYFRTSIVADSELLVSKSVERTPQSNDRLNLYKDMRHVREDLEYSIEKYKSDLYE